MAPGWAMLASGIEHWTTTCCPQPSPLLLLCGGNGHAAAYCNNMGADLGSWADQALRGPRGLGGLYRWKPLGRLAFGGKRPHAELSCDLCSAAPSAGLCASCSFLPEGGTDVCCEAAEDLCHLLWRVQKMPFWEVSVGGMSQLWTSSPSVLTVPVTWAASASCRVIAMGCGWTDPQSLGNMKDPTLYACSLDWELSQNSDLSSSVRRGWGKTAVGLLQQVFILHINW